MSHTISLHTWQQASDVLAKAAEWIKRRTEAGKPVKLTLEEERRTNPQNRLIHVTVARIAATAGRPTDTQALDELRWLLVEQWRSETKRPGKWVKSLDGLRMVDVSNRTSKLDKADGSEFLEWLLAWEASA
jgi:hypothetical protein